MFNKKYSPWKLVSYFVFWAPRPWNWFLKGPPIRPSFHYHHSVLHMRAPGTPQWSSHKIASHHHLPAKTQATRTFQNATPRTKRYVFCMWTSPLHRHQTTIYGTMVQHSRLRNLSLALAVVKIIILNGSTMFLQKSMMFLRNLCFSWDMCDLFYEHMCVFIRTHYSF